MNEEIILSIAKELKVKVSQVKAALEMLENGDTVPFIARYRKEQTGSLDEEQLLSIEKSYQYEVNLKERKEAVLNLIEQQGKLTDELVNSINACTKLSEVEDLYRPYKQKKKTRAAVAIKNGLEPLSQYLLSLPKEGDLTAEASKYLNENIKNVEEAVNGAKDIIAEMVSDNAKLRWAFKDEILKSASIVTKAKKDIEDPNKVYEMYYDYTEKLSTLANHRVMANDRAEKEKKLTVSFAYDVNELEEEAYKAYITSSTYVEDILKSAINDGLDRLLLPSIENEIRSDFSKRAHDASIEIFAKNLEQLLSQPPLKGRIVLGFDPGFYNGCKLAVLDETGKMLTVAKIYPFASGNKKEDISVSKSKLLKLIKDYKVELIAIGNGTASRESEKLVAEVIKENGLNTSYAIVTDAGASVWSAQEAARKELPELQLDERSALSIARRLLDPLPELIKIDPKSMGVGQYQHDVPQSQLSERLDETTMKVVNRVGADLNTASVELLTHVAGLNAGIAREIVNYRNENGKFNNRQELLNVKKLGPKAFTQCAGFLRIVDGDEPLDATSIHPESYEATHKLMEACGIEKLGEPDAVFPEEKTKDLGIDEYTLKDIEEAIRTPLRDYRDQFEGAILKSDVLELKDLTVGQELHGTVRNVVDFGAFVDIGLHEDGLVHISRMSMKKVNHPSEIVSVNDIVTVYVYEINEEKGRVQLSLLSLDDLAKRDQMNKQRANGKKQYNKKPKKQEPTMDEAMAKLLARFGK